MLCTVHNKVLCTILFTSNAQHRTNEQRAYFNTHTVPSELVFKFEEKELFFQTDKEDMPLRHLPYEIKTFYHLGQYKEADTVIKRADYAFKSMQRIQLNQSEDEITDLLNIIASYFDTLSQHGNDISKNCGTDEWVSQTRYLMWNFLHTGMNYHDVSNNEQIRLVVRELPARVLPNLLTLFVCEKITGYHVAFLLDEISPMLERIKSYNQNLKK